MISSDLLSTSNLHPYFSKNNFDTQEARRMSYHSSWWQGLTHRSEKNRLDHQLSSAIESFFKDRYHFENHKDFKRVWKEVGANQLWTLSHSMDDRVLNTIDAAFKRHLVYHGKGIPAPSEASSHFNNNVRQVAQSLFHGGNLTKDIISKELLGAFFVRKNPKLLKNFRQELQLELQSLITNPPRNNDEAIVWNAFLGNVLAILPFSYPENNEKIFIPILQSAGSGFKCELIEYNIEVIPMERTADYTPMNALGLTPTMPTSFLPPILIYLGTTYPGADGFAATILADTTPGFSVGHNPFIEGEERINLWFLDKSQVHVIGASLGGALAFHTLINHQKKIAKLDVYNPPGLFPGQWTHPYDSDVEINIYCQSGDIVSRLGQFPIGNNVHLYNIIPHQEGVNEGVVSSHNKAFTGCKKVTILKRNPEETNRDFFRRSMTAFYRVFAPIVYWSTRFIVWITKPYRNGLSRANSK